MGVHLPKPNKRLALFIGIILLIALAGAGAYYYLSRDKNVEQVKKEPTTAAESVQDLTGPSAPTNESIMAMEKFAGTTTNPEEKYNALFGVCSGYQNLYDKVQEAKVACEKALAYAKEVNRPKENIDYLESMVASLVRRIEYLESLEDKSE